MAHDVLGMSWRQRERTAEAQSAIEKAVALTEVPRYRRPISATCMPASVTGSKRDRFSSSSAKPRRRDTRQPWRSRSSISVWVKNDQALNWLEKAYEERFNRLAYLKREPVWDPLRLGSAIRRSAAPHQPAAIDSSAGSSGFVDGDRIDVSLALRELAGEDDPFLVGRDVGVGLDAAAAGHVVVPATC